MNKKLRLITGNVNRDLAKQIAIDNLLNCPLTKANIGTFPGGEISVEIEDNIRGCDVFIIQSVCGNTALSMSPNDALMELLVMIDAARRASAQRITVVMPYYGYARQDRKDKSRVPITAKLVANMLVGAGANRILTLDLHASQIQGFFDIPVDHLYTIGLFADYLRNRINAVAAPDVGAVRVSQAYSTLLNETPMVIVIKKRLSGTESKIINIIGDPKNMHVALIDDLTSTGTTLANGANALMDAGAASVRAVVVHPVFAIEPDRGIDCVRKLRESKLVEVIISDSIPLAGKTEDSFFKVVSISHLIAEAISHIHREESVSVMF